MTPPRYALGLLLFFLSLSASNLRAQTAATRPRDSIGRAHREWPTPRAEDVRSVDNILKSYFEVISGRAETPRDWRRFRSLFLPEGRIVALHT
ncbi:MAG TPA: hypothetical protein VFN62_08550, partial [Acidobacteriaceae bacterium]|nr:hypothetical protein [Acidobacteriaceae bacterium]